FGHNDPIRYKDPDGKWEEDGHYWTVYALGMAMGLSKSKAQYLASKAEFYDHHTLPNSKMSLHYSHEHGKTGLALGLGTWSDRELQKSWHGLTGGRQSEVLIDAMNNILMKGDLNQLHKVGDAWAHSYIDENGERTMWGKTTTWIPGLGRITLEHAFEGGHGNKDADNLNKRPGEYQKYIQSLVQIYNSKSFAFNSDVKNGRPDLSIFTFVQKNGGNKEGNIFLLSSFIDMKAGAKSISSTNKGHIEKFKSYLDQQGIKYTLSEGQAQATLLPKGCVTGPVNYTITFQKPESK
ncbi:hypothetical protein, partial [Flaviaesturariibacter flavus]